MGDFNEFVIRQEFIARRFAAWKMKLIKDHYGERLPDDLWEQVLPEVQFILQALTDWEQRK